MKLEFDFTEEEWKAFYYMLVACEGFDFTGDEQAYSQERILYQLEDMLEKELGLE